MNKNITKIISLTTVLTLASSSSVFASEVKKDEAVYITMNSKGSILNTTVSDWLHSDDGFNNFKDTSDLKNIINVKGNDTPVINGNSATWNSKAADIFYQGNTDKELPLTFSITYKLNGKVIEPADLAGKSGKVEIKVKIINKDKHQININGENKTIYTPFLSATVVTLPMDNFKNAVVNSGEMISDGNNNIITFLSIPGLKESLDIEDKENKIKDELTITADADNFSLPSIIITSTCKLPSIDKIDAASSIDELQNGLSDLKDASSKILNGIGSLNNGSDKLNKGIGSLYDGVSSLYSGSLKLKDGTNGIYTGLSSAKSGSEKLNSGMDQLKAGSSELIKNSADLYNGASELNSGLKGLQSGISSLNSGADKLLTGASSAKEGYSEQMAQYKALEANLEAIINTLNPNDENQKPLIDSLNKELYGLKSVTDGYSSKIAPGLTALEGGLQGLKNSIDNPTNKITENTPTLKAAVNQLYEGSASLKDGTDKFKGGIYQLNAGLSDAAKGAADLNTGLGKLYAGSSSLNKGETDLSNGILTAKKGVSDIKEGSNQLYNGTSELKSNYEKFNSDGISELSDKLDEKINDINELLDEKDALVKLSKDYKVFSGDSENVEGSTKFIFKTEEIKAPEKAKKENKVSQTAVPKESKGGFFSWLISLFK